MKASMLAMIRSDFYHDIEMVLHLWRLWLPDDAPPALPNQQQVQGRVDGRAFWAEDAHRTVDEADRHFEGVVRRNDAIIAPVNEEREKAMRTTEASPTTLELACAVLSPAQAVIFTVLWERRVVGYDALLNTPRAFQEGVTDEAVTKQLKEIKRRLEAINLPVGYMEISTTKRSVRLTN
jgi:hypothetical protein